MEVREEGLISVHPWLAQHLHLAATMPARQHGFLHVQMNEPKEACTSIPHLGAAYSCPDASMVCSKRLGPEEGDHPVAGPVILFPRCIGAL
jgi:hypothetical protein